jgi:DNA gyrase subunit A
MHKLFKYTPLEDSFSCNFNILIDGRPKVLGVKSILHEWIRFRMTCIVRQLTFELVGLNEKLHLLLGLERVLLDIDKAIRIIRETEEDQQVIGNLMQAFRIDEIQADFVANIRLRNLNKDYLIKRIDEIVSLKKMIDDKTVLKSSEIKIKQLMITELKGVIKKYSQPRKTIVLKEHLSSAVIPETMIEDYNVKLFLTDHGYFKKITLVSLRASAIQKIKDDDVLMQECDASNLSDVLLFSNKQNVYKLKCHEISEHKASELGHFLSNLLELEEGERIIYMHSTTDYKGHLILGLDNGKMAKVPLASYETKQNRKKLINAYTDKGKLVRMLTIIEDVNLAVVRTEKDGTKTMIVLTSALIPEKTTRNTQGVQIMRLKKDSYLSSVHLTSELNLESIGHYSVDSVPVAGVKLSPIDNFSYPDL